MDHHLVKWKSIKCKSRFGNDVCLGVPEIVDIRIRGTLLSRILSMPKKSPISFELAMLKLIEKRREKFDAGHFGDEPGRYGWYCHNFVDWISSQGLHIELTGDEFETRFRKGRVRGVVKSVEP